MTELADRDPMHDDTDWLVGEEPAPVDAISAGPKSGGRRTALAGVGLVTAGLLVGGVGVAALRPHSSPNNATPTGFAQNGQIPNGNGQLPNGQLQGGQGGFGGPGGGVDGEQRVTGSVVSVGSASIRIRTSSGTASYGVTGQTEIVRNGALASLSAVQPGDDVFVHLIPSSGSSYVVERLFVQASTSAGGTSGTGSTSTTGDAT